MSRISHGDISGNLRQDPVASQPICALQIWKQLANECSKAVGYYTNKCPLSTQKKILKQGAADFDQKYYPNDAHEKAHYRTDFYVSDSGYMDMHIKQNLQAIRESFKDGIPESLLFVDFGCGPMTSGLALAEVLFKQTPNYKTHTSYFGIDASRNMVAKANYINERHRLFAPERFKVVQGTQFDSTMIPQSFSNSQDMVLFLSFVLAPQTYQADNIGKLAEGWKQHIENQLECKQTKIVYLNPLDAFFHSNWYVFKKSMLTSNAIGRFCYTCDNDIELPVREIRRPVYYAMILGVRNGA